MELLWQSSLVKDKAKGRQSFGCMQGSAHEMEKEEVFETFLDLRVRAYVQERRYKEAAEKKT